MTRRPERELWNLFKRAFPPRRRVPVVVLLFRGRYELGALLGAAALGYLGLRYGWVAVAYVVTGLLVGTFGRPGGVAYLRDSCWAVFVQHRLRTAFREAGVVTWSGRYPAVLWTTIGPDVVYVQVLCPAGLDAAAVDAEASVLAAACCATTVTVDPHPRNAARLTLAVRRSRSAP